MGVRRANITDRFYAKTEILIFDYCLMQLRLISKKLDCIADLKIPINREEDLLRFEADLFEDAPGIGTGMRPANWDLPQGPEPGPQWPRKKRPQIL
jgi:hypothetical protein